MEPLFRFVLRRPPVEQADETQSIELAQETTLQDALEQVQGSDNVRGEMKAAARRYTTTADYITDYDNLELGPELTALESALEALETDDDLIEEWHDVHPSTRCSHSTRTSN